MLIYFLALVLVGQPADSTEGIVVTFEGFDSFSGFVRVAVFDSPEFWPEDKDSAALAISSPVEGEMVTVEITSLPPGSYSIAAFHDRDGDEVLDKGLFGVPTERYGFSNNVRGSTGPPDYEDALFQFTGESIEMSILLR